MNQSILSGFVNMKLKSKILSGFGVIFLFLAAVIAIYQFSIKDVTKEFDHLLAHEVLIKGHADNIQMLALKIQTLADDFLLHKNMEDLDKIKESVAQLKEEAETGIGLADKAKYDVAIKKAENIIKLADEYQRIFEKFVKAWQVQGLDRFSGLTGEVTDLAALMMKDMKQYDVGELHTRYLQLLRYTNNYTRTRNSKDKNKLMQAVSAYERLLEQSQCEVISKRIQKERLNEYSRSFNRYIDADKDSRDKYRWAMNSALTDIEKALDNILVPGCQQKLLQLRRREKDYYMRNDPKYVKAVYSWIDDIGKSFRDSKIARSHVVNMEDNLSAYKKAFSSIVEGRVGIETLSAAMDTHVHNVLELSDEIAKMVQEVLGVRSEEIMAKGHDKANIAMGLGIGALILGTIIAFFMGNMISRPIVKVSEIVRRIFSERDFTLNVPIESADEIGAMSIELNNLMEQLRINYKGADQVVINVEKHAIDVGKRATANKDRAGAQQNKAAEMQNTIKEMGITAGEVAQFSNSQKEAAATSGERVDSLVKAMDDMDKATQRSSEHGQQVLAAAEEGTSAVSETVKGMQNIAESSDQIAEIIAVITEIAEKTDLLALNAAIEAARAGEHGKGFAVVADEVGKLAQRSSEAAKEITKLIRDSVARVKEGTRLTGDSRLALAKIMEGGQINMEAIAGISKVVAAMVSDTRRIGDEMEEIATRSDEMDKLTSLQAGRSGKLVNMSMESAEVAAKTVEGAGIVVGITEDLQQESLALKQEVETFKYEA